MNFCQQIANTFMLPKRKRFKPIHVCSITCGSPIFICTNEWNICRYNQHSMIWQQPNTYTKIIYLFANSANLWTRAQESRNLDHLYIVLDILEAIVYKLWEIIFKERTYHVRFHNCTRACRDIAHFHTLKARVRSFINMKPQVTALLLRKFFPYRLCFYFCFNDQVQRNSYSKI